MAISLDELCVLRWVNLSDAERERSPMGPPTHALARVSTRIMGKQKIDKRLLARSEDILKLTLACADGKR